MDGPEGILIEQPLLLGKIARLVFDNSQMKRDEIVSRLGSGLITRIGRWPRERLQT